MKRKVWIGSAVGAVALVLVTAGLLSPTAQAGVTLFEQRTPTMTADQDTQSVELGVRFSADVSGSVTAIRFYKSQENVGPHAGSLWSSGGRKLAGVTFENETSNGWQEAELDTPVRITAGRTYVASYVAPSGRYAGDEHGFDAAFTTDHLTVPVGGGVYKYGAGGFPTQVYNNSNYYVDVTFVAGVVSGGTGGTGGNAPAEPGADPTTATPTPTPTPSTSPSTSPSTAPAPTQTSGPTSAANALGLPRVPWEGGPDYYRQFSQSKTFADPNVFPTGVWWGDFDTDANVKWDKDHGINFYVQLNGGEDGRLLARNQMSWVGSDPLKNMADNDPAWAGWWLSDETDGRYDPPSSGQAQVQKEIDAQRARCADNSTTCRFSYANYTTIVTSKYNATQIAADEKYVNMYKGPVSVDGYYYTDPSCDSATHVDYAENAPDKAHCRSAANYGNLIKTLRKRDAADGELKPLWGFVENGAPQTVGGLTITPDQMRAAAWSMVINEARGLVWFNQSFSGGCQSGNVLRTAEANPSGCSATRVQAMKDTNKQIQSFAPILNTQSYQWTFGGGLDTMLKVKDGSAYVFSMIGVNTDAGTRTFTLPPSVNASSVEVVGENRTVAVSGGKFTDTFKTESATHIYKINL